MNIKSIPLKKAIAAGAILSSAGMFAPYAVLAADTGTVSDAISAANGNGGNNYITLPTTFGFSTLSQALNTVISLIFLIAGLAAFVYILLGAFNYLTAGDDSTKTTKARTMITNAVVGLLLVALVYVIWILAVNLVPGMKTFFNPTTASS